MAIQKISNPKFSQQQTTNNNPSIILIMKKPRSFQQNSVHDLQYQQQFARVLQIDGLTLQPQKQLFPSLKSILKNRTAPNIIGHGPNANIRAFYYLLLCHLRKQHFKKLLNQLQQKEVDRLTQEDEGFRDRRVSFNGKTAVFLNGPQYENYALYKLRIYAFSQTTDLTIIQNSPFQQNSAFKYNQTKLSSPQLKKLLSEFLKQLLPTQLQKDYKTTLKSVRYHLNQHSIAGVLLTLVMRNILFSHYQIQSARNYSQQLNDHTVCTTLCDAFAIDGLKCKDNVYEINTWCKVYAVQNKSEKIIFVEMYNDQFQELGLINDNKYEENKVRESETKGSNNFSKHSEEPSNSHLLSVEEFKFSQKKGQSCKNSQGSNSVMDQDQDSQIASGSQGRSSCKDTLKIILSQPKIINQQTSYEAKDCIRQTFNTKKKEVQNNILQNLQKQSINLPQKKIKAQLQKVNENITNQNSFKKKSNCLEQSQHSSQFSQNTSTQPQTESSAFFHQPPSAPQPTKMQLDLQPPSLPKPKSKQQPTPNIVNNNISNNIYLNLGDKQYIPVINISTGNRDPNCININLT